MYLFPKVTQRGKQLTALDIAVRRPDVAMDPTEVHGIYIDEGIAKYAIAERVDGPVVPADWAEVRAMDFAKDVSIAFDGSWQKLPDNKARFYSVGEPWIFIVTPDGKLYTMQGDTGLPYDLVPTGVKMVDTIRGWRDTRTNSEDQGLIAAYIKEDGLVYYRSRALQESGTESWELEKVLPGLPEGKTFTEVRLLRTNDYRVGFIVSDGLELTMLLTERTWAGMAVDADMTYVSPYSTSLTITPITYTDLYHGETDTVAVAYHSSITGLLYGVSNYSIRGLRNIDAFTIEFTLIGPVTSLDQFDLRLVDSTDYVFRIDSFTTADNQTFTLAVEDFNNAEGDMTLQFLGTGTTRGEAGQTIIPFDTSFTPVGLVPTPKVPPIPVTLTNVEG